MGLFLLIVQELLQTFLENRLSTVEKYDVESGRSKSKRNCNIVTSLKASEELLTFSTG